jgi:hypothetical protein
VVVITKEKTALFSPDDVDGFLGAIQAAVAVPQSPPGEAVTGSPRRRRDRSWILTLVGAAVGLTAIALAVLATLYSPGLPSYTLTPEALTIHDRFYPVTLNPAAVDVARIRMVDISSDPDWRPTERTNGFANAYYRSGWFRVASGRKVRMYCADGRRLVLLPPKGNGVPVLLEVWEPERFVEEVRRLWSGRS